MRHYLLIFIILWLVFLVPSLATAQKRKDRVIKTFNPEQYEIQLCTLDGKPVGSVGDMARGKVLIISFWTYWCISCRVEMPDLQKLYDYFQGNPDIVFVFVTIDDSKNDESNKIAFLVLTRAFIKEFSLHIPIYSANSVDFSKSFFDGKYWSVPATFIVARDGRVVFHKLDGANWNNWKVKAKLKTLLAQ